MLREIERVRRTEVYPEALEEGVEETAEGHNLNYILGGSRAWHAACYCDAAGPRTTSTEQCAFFPTAAETLPKAGLC